MPKIKEKIRGRQEKTDAKNECERSKEAEYTRDWRSSWYIKLNQVNVHKEACGPEGQSVRQWDFAM